MKLSVQAVLRGRLELRITRLPRLAGSALTLLSFWGNPLFAQTVAAPANDFLKSTGVNTHIDQGYAEAPYEVPLKFTGIRNVRDGHRNLRNFVTLHNNTIVAGSYPGVKVSICSRPGSMLTSDGTTLINAGALFAFEGRNEPNNEPFAYNGATGGGSGTWVPVAQWQRDYYMQIKGDPTLKNYPVFNCSEGGAETDNVGLQFLTIPSGAGTLMPDGTKYADYANCHNYVDAHPPVTNNIAWMAAEPALQTSIDGISIDGMYGEYNGVTWGHHFTASSTNNTTIPKVCTETSWGTIGHGAVSEDQQGKILLNVYLSQFKRGWFYTAWYELHDGEGGDSTGEGIYRSDWTAKPAATYMHNFTAILADLTSDAPGSLSYSIPSEPLTVHDLLLQKSRGTFELIVWDDKPVGSATDYVTVNLGATYTTVKVYDPTLGTTAAQTLHGVASVPLTLSDHALIIEVPSGSETGILTRH